MIYRKNTNPAKQFYNKIERKISLAFELKHFQNLRLETYNFRFYLNIVLVFSISTFFPYSHRMLNALSFDCDEPLSINIFKT